MYRFVAALLAGLLAFWVFAASATQRSPEIAMAAERLELDRPWKGEIAGDRLRAWQTTQLDANQLYSLTISLNSVPIENNERYLVSLVGSGFEMKKTLHAGDPSLFLTFRPRKTGAMTLSCNPAGSRMTSNRKIHVSLGSLALSAHEQIAFEAEPNDDWQRANPLKLGRVLYGGSDDLEYLDNQEEYQSGWDWFRIDFEEREPKLVFFEVDLADRDIPAQLLFYRHDPASDSIEPYTRGKDPMEVLHDGQKIRYSKFISRVLTPGRYYLSVLGNHPSYILRSTSYPVPPYDNPSQAVQTAMHYIVGIGDAWFNQVPRLGARHRRSVMLHDEAQRCTACHPTVFPLESTLTAYKNGYPIRAKSQFQYLMERVYNAPTPLYGNPGVNWVRFVAIELQFFGKQGGLVIDYENSVTGQPTDFLNRFGGFLHAAWDHRSDLPEDENNGVSPIDSKFGFAWRDWRVLAEQAHRTGDVLAEKAAHHIEQIVASPASVSRIEGTQDRLHRLHGLSVMDRKRYASEIEKEVRYFLDLQNPDGSWPGTDEKPSGGERRMDSTEGVEYLTGQAIHTLLTAGAGSDQRERLEKAARWLMSRQKEFGGWFQTETIENFVTPMRETRYAIMALASLFPIDPARHGIGNRDEKPARLPRADSLLHVLDDLDNLWQAPENHQSDFISAIVPLLRHKDATVRALAAQSLGRIGSADAVKPLIEQLDDPVKMVWQSAAWALRQLGNRGIGVEAIRSALRSPNPATRRGAARVFAYQFYGMDERFDILEDFLPLLAEPDLMTRHQAVRTLSQWWYRTVDRDVRRRVFQAFIDRLADAREHPLQRFNLSQGVYNLLDENLGSPGTGYGRWINYLEPQKQDALRAERRWQEQEILMKPVLSALIEGPPAQRLGVVLGFDGTPFWRGYTTAAFGPGNDRAFDFESKYDFEGLGEAFESVLSRLDYPEELSYGLRLAAFFDAFRDPHARRLSPLFLGTLPHPDQRVRNAALEVADKVSLQGDESQIVPALLRSADQPEARLAVLKLLRANSALLEHGELAGFVRRSVEDSELSSMALPLMASPRFTDDEALAALMKAWPRSLPQDTDESESYRKLLERNSLLSRQELERSRRGQTVPPPQAFVDSLDLLEKRPSLLEKPAVILRLAGAARVDNSRVRQLVFEFLSRHAQIAGHRLLLPLAQQALMDIRNEVRRAALKLAASNSEVLRFPEVYDYLLRLLIDSDTQVRKLALEVVAREKLIAREARLAGRVKVLESEESDASVRRRAAEVLRDAGLDPADVKPSGALAKPRLPDFETFRREVNQYFYLESAKDGRACANCHATHRILRLAEPPRPGQELTESDLQENFRSLLKVIDIAEPEHSLVLRKPLSPSGQGEESQTSPTGLTHVGGTRWSGPNDPAYQTILRWLRTAATPAN